MRRTQVDRTVVTSRLPSAAVAEARQIAGLHMLNRLLIRSWLPVVKQIPTASMFLIAFIMASLLDVLPISNLPVLVSAGVVMLIATGLAGLFSTRTALYRFEIVIILLDFIAVALFRFGTGESASIFGVMLILPLVWMAALDGRIHIACAALGGAFVIFLPVPVSLILDGEAPVSSDLLRSAFSLMVYAIAAAVINEISHQARVNLQRSHLRELASSEELQRAAAVQRALLPKNQSLLPGYQVAGTCVPSRSVGGDFFDWYEIDGGLAITMGDVMGKGVGAGMVAATARAVVRGAASEPDPTVALGHMAACLDNELKDASTFLTLFHARLNAANGSLDYADAGHGLTLIVRHDGTHQRMDSPDLPVGILPDPAWTRQRIELAPGDTLVCFSDGVLDLYDGTLAAIAEIATITHASTSAHAVAEAVAAIARQQQNDDDVTIMALRREPVRASVPAAVYSV